MPRLVRSSRVAPPTAYAVTTVSESLGTPTKVEMALGSQSVRARSEPAVAPAHMFSADRPITSAKEDKLSRGKFAR